MSLSKRFFLRQINQYSLSRSLSQRAREREKEIERERDRVGGGAGSCGKAPRTAPPSIYSTEVPRRARI